MPESLIIDWLNENQYRAYPLKNKGNRAFGSGLNLDTIILDANLVAPYLSDNVSVVINNISVSGSDCIISTNIGSFTVTSYLTASYPYYIRNSHGLLVVSSDITQVVGINYFLSVEFEESVVSIFDSYWSGVASISFNSDFINNSSIELQAGYQFQLSADEDTSTITFGANRLYGIPIGCEEFFPDIPKDCDSLIAYIDGVGVTNNGGSFTFTAGSNIAIYNDPDNNRIYIGLNFEPEDVCVNINARPNPNIQ